MNLKLGCLLTVATPASVALRSPGRLLISVSALSGVLAFCGCVADATAPAERALPGDRVIRTRDEVLRELAAVTENYAAEVRAAHGATFAIAPDWARTDIGLATSVHAGGLWKLRPSAGLATSGISVDAMQVIACHEIGHFLGGFPFHHAQNSSLATDRTVLAAEGQADYYAAKDCLPRIWRDDTANVAYAARIPSEYRALCDAAYAAPADQAICYRIIATSTAYAQTLEVDVALTTPVTEMVTETKLGHFDAQRRLDTIVAGALCAIKQPPTVIPGVTDKVTRGAPYQPEAEAAAKPYACAEGVGARPRSWFRPDAPPPFDCAAFGNDRCEGADHVYCTSTGIERYTCEAGCVTDELGAYCK